MVPLVFATTGPCGTITADAFERIADEMLAPCAGTAPGTASSWPSTAPPSSESYPDADGELAARVRDLVGPGDARRLSLDMHANLTQRMIAEHHRDQRLPHQPPPGRPRARPGLRHPHRAHRAGRDPSRAGPRDAPPGDQHRQAVHRRGADAGPDGGLRPRRRPARDALRQRRRGLPLRRRPGDGHGLPRRPRRRSRGRRAAAPAGWPAGPGSGAADGGRHPRARRRPCATPPAPPGGRSC